MTQQIVVKSEWDQSVRNIPWSSVFTVKGGLWVNHVYWHTYRRVERELIREVCKAYERC